MNDDSSYKREKRVMWYIWISSTLFMLLCLVFYKEGLLM